MRLPSLHRLRLLPRTGMAPADEESNVAEQAPDASANGPPLLLVSSLIHRRRNAEVEAQSNRLARLALQDADAFRDLLWNHLLITADGVRAVHAMLATCLTDKKVPPAMMALRILWEKHALAGLYHSYARIVGASLRMFVNAVQETPDSVDKIAQFIAGMRFWYTSQEMVDFPTWLDPGEPEAQLMSKGVLVAFAASILQTDAQRDALRSHPLMA